LWWLADSGKLSKETRRLIAQAADVYVSAASVWEIGIKRALGKLEITEDLQAEIEKNSFRALPIEVRHAVAAGKLPRHHDDPFDRMLVAQAAVESLTLVTSDRRLAAYNSTISLI
jgi:PIN domain nuclease of toxin-antitoxin system